MYSQDYLSNQNICTETVKSYSILEIFPGNASEKLGGLLFQICWPSSPPPDSWEAQAAER
jgi:hypothetical protein